MSTENPIEKLALSEDFNIQQLPRTTKVKRQILAIIQTNPFIEGYKTQSFNEAKKARTALKTTRTDVEKSKKTVLVKIKQIFLTL
jgi:ribosomal protein S8